MTPRPAPLKRALRAGALALVAWLAAPAARATPLDLSTPAGLDALAQWMSQYRNVSRARWVISAPSREQAEAKRNELVSRLSPHDLDLLPRVEIESSANGGVRAWLTPIVGANTGSPNCSWQVWVEDPAAPGPGDEPIMTPLAPNDRIPVGPAATFRVGHAGLVQSRLYAFGETRNGAVRDLAGAPDVNIPVTHDAEGETIVLATARQPSPFFESVKTALADSQGERRDLGERYDLRQKMLGGGRGIGANIQAIPQSMIATPVAAPSPSATKESLQTSLLEACVYQMTPRP